MVSFSVLLDTELNEENQSTVYNTDFKLAYAIAACNCIVNHVFQRGLGRLRVTRVRLQYSGSRTVTVTSGKVSQSWRGISP